MSETTELAPSIESDITVPTSLIQTDITLMKSGKSEPQDHTSTTIIKTEPSDDGNNPDDVPENPETTVPQTTDEEFPPLPELGSPGLDENRFMDDDMAMVDDAFEQSMAMAQQEFNRQSIPDMIPPDDEDYEDAILAVDQKRVDVAPKRSLNMDVVSDEIELQRLEDKLSLARKSKFRAKQHAQRERENSTMFFAEGELSDEDSVELLQAPSRREPFLTPHHNSVIDISDDEGEDVKAKIKAGHKRKYTRKMAATSKSTKKPKTNRKGGYREVEMLNMGSLIRNDIVADAKANQGVRQQPTLGAGKNKEKALRALIASIPEEERNTARSEKKALSDACRVFGWRGIGSMKADGASGWRLKGMASSLRHFQLLSVAEGVKKERGSTAPFGGMLADTMGYGKTIQMIAMMVENHPNAGAKHKTTLVVVPSSITSQWFDEIAKHVEDGIMENVYIYKAGSRPPEDEAVRFLKRQQVVITTYSEVMRHYPKGDPPIHLATEAAKDAWWAKHYEDNKGPLLQIKFHRVILDEAQAIKNHESRTSRSCRQLSAKYKWVLTGTPLSNRMEELFPYFEFLGVEGSNTFGQFQHNYAKRNDKTMQRLDTMLRTVMIRRTGSSRLFGAPLVSLPALDHQTVQIDFDPVERAIYTVVRQRFISRINDWTRSNNKITQMSKNILVMLTRLRQMCAHVLMVSTTMRDLLEAEDIEKLWKSIERHSNSSNDTGKKTGNVLKRILREARDENAATGATPPPDFDNFDNSTIDLTIEDKVFDYRTFFYQLERDGLLGKIKSRSPCTICGLVPDEEHARISVPCVHFYCESCINELFDSAKTSLTEAECASCHNLVTHAADLLAMKQIADQARQDQHRRVPREPIQAKGRKAKEDPDLKWLDTKGVDKLSSKAQAVEATIAEWIESDPNAKIIIFTLWIPMIKIFAKVCTRRGWGFSEYTGKHSADQRNRDLHKFKTSSPEDQRVLLMSTKAGGTGLNLVEASYCCMVDPWWNEPVEDQAYSRIYRIGQPKDCIVRRFLIKDAIDTQLMLWLQRVKAEECERVIDGRSVQKLTIKDMMEMFGPTQRDAKSGEEAGVNEGNDASDDFVISSEKVVIDDSEDEQVMPAPARPREE